MLFVCACFCVDNSDDFERKNSRLFLSRGAPTCLNPTLNTTELEFSHKHQLKNNTLLLLFILLLFFFRRREDDAFCVVVV